MSQENYYHGEPDYATPPGSILEDVLEDRSISQVDLARRLGITKKTVNAIIKGNAPITHETAIGLERVLGSPASFWLNAESLYRTRKKRIEENLAQHKEILRLPPMKELVKRRLIPEYATPESGIESLLKFFGQASVEKLKACWKRPTMALRHSPTYDGDDIALATWLRIGQVEASKRLCGVYNHEVFLSALKEIRRLTNEKPTTFLPQIIELCAKSGVAVSFIPELKSASVQGAASWISPRKAMILVNLRGRKNDIFWFTFFHEAAHILSGKKKSGYVDLASSTSNDEEKKADKFAADFLIPPQCSGELNGLRSRADVIRFSRKIQIHPGIVVGRLHYEKLIPFAHWNDLRESYRWSTNH